MDDALIEPLHEARERAYDAARPEAVDKIHQRGRLTARERIDAVIDPGSFVETGVLAGADGEAAGGLVAGLATVFGATVSICSYDYSVWGGTQTGINHSKIDRIMDLAIRYRWPFVCFADGGGARAQGLRNGSFGGQAMSHEVGTFDGMALLSGLVPTVAVVSGRSFAGNASIAGMSDVVFATRGSAIGIGGPPLVEAALGIAMTPEELAPSEMQEQIGGIDLLIDTDAEGAELTRRYLSYFLVEQTEFTQSPTHDTIRAIVPDNRRGVYDMRKVVRALADEGTVFELRPKWATAALTALVRMGGRTVALIANQPMSPIAGAIDSNAADKLARFISLADAYDLPIVSLMDNPGFMLGPQAERAGNRPAPRPPADGPGASHRAAVPGPRAQGLRPRPDGDGWDVPADGSAARLADGGGRGHVTGGRRGVDPPQGGATGERRRGRADRAATARRAGLDAAREQPGDQCGPPICVRRGDRSGRDARPDHPHDGSPPGPRSAGSQEALHRHMVRSRALDSAAAPGPR